MDHSTGLTIRSGPWSRQQILAYLDEAAIPIRLASSGGYPMVQSLWFLADDEALWCATRSSSVLASRLRANDRCGFEISADAPPYRGVRGRGHASLVPELAAHVLPRLIDRYLGAAPSPLAAWLMSRIDDEVAIRIDRLTVTSWDYSARM
jgi:nitroimidazol reductase NimA-like FMN-containing flavoprotein (pyridoxamine 5'-phosphate oxidase superfamily)